MTDERWTAVDEYFTGLLVPEDEALEAAREESAAAGLPAIAVSPAQGKLLHLLALTAGARSVLEIGTLGGYSTIWLARALPADGRLISLEADEHHAVVARDNVARAGLSGRVEIRVGRALDTLPGLHDEDPDPFDLVFIDADKANIPGYFEWALRLTRPGSLVIVDNVVRAGAVVDTDRDDPDVEGVRRFAEQLATERRASGTVVQTVGAKGYDGFALVVVAAEA